MWCCTVPARLALQRAGAGHRQSPPATGAAARGRGGHYMLLRGCPGVGSTEWGACTASGGRGRGCACSRQTKGLQPSVRTLLAHQNPPPSAHTTERVRCIRQAEPARPASDLRPRDGGLPCAGPRLSAFPHTHHHHPGLPGRRVGRRGAAGERAPSRRRRRGAPRPARPPAPRGLFAQCCRASGSPPRPRPSATGT